MTAVRARRLTGPPTLPLIPEAAILEALSRHLDAPADPLPEGEYPVRGTATVRLDCTVSRAADTTAAQAARLDLIGTLASLARAAGVAPSALPAMLAAALAAPVAEGDPYRDLAEVVIARARAAAVAALPRVPRAGATKVIGAVELVDFTRT